MTKIIYKDICYVLNGIFFQLQKELGRFCREKQYSDRFEELLKEKGLEYKREYEIKKMEEKSPKGNKVDFLIDNKIIIEFKAKNFITKEDYFQTMRYIQSAKLKLGLLINMRDKYLKAKRVLNKDTNEEPAENSHHSHCDYSQHSHRPGYVILISVLIVGVVGLAITTTLVLLGTDFYRTSFTLEKSNKAKSLANACAYKALQTIRTDNYFLGTSTIDFGSNSCDYTVVDKGSEARELQLIGTVSNVTRRVKIEFSDINPTFVFTSWQEVSDF
jgi:GxxExxY protein